MKYLVLIMCLFLTCGVALPPKTDCTILSEIVSEEKRVSLMLIKEAQACIDILGSKRCSFRVEHAIVHKEKVYDLAKKVYRSYKCAES